MFMTHTVDLLHVPSVTVECLSRAVVDGTALDLCTRDSDLQTAHTNENVTEYNKNLCAADPSSPLELQM